MSPPVTYGSTVSAPSVDVIRWGRERARTGPWRGDPTVAFIAPLPGAPSPSADFVRRCKTVLAARGFERAVTAALSPFEQGGFIAAGFEVAEELHLLALSVDGLPPLVEGLELTRVSAAQRREVLALDQLAFTPFWRFEEDDLIEALRATPRTRFRGAVHPTVPDGNLAGYAICGRSGPRGFVQRLAVHPAAQGRQLGKGLLLDGLHWMRRRGGRRALVNTQLNNVAALGLYRSVGFRDEPAGLSVLSAGLR